jgi:hypothetical protein
MRRLVGVLSAGLLLASACTGDDPSNGTVPDEARTSAEATTTPSPEPTPSAPPGPRRLRVLGHEDFGGRGFNGDVWALGDHAYVGTYGGKTEETDCPQGGVQVVDISEPRAPKMVARLETEPFTTAEDVVARSIDTKDFRGDIAVVGLQACNVDDDPDSGTFRGLQFFDVTQPAAPRELSTWRLPGNPAGCHEVDLIARGERVLAGCAAPFGKEAGIDEAHVIDASDPREPRTLFAWSLDEGPGGGVGCLPAKVVHNIRFGARATRAYLSYWDAGTVILDISDAREPRVAGRIEPVPIDPDGDNHSVAEVSKDTLIVLHEDFSPALPAARFGGCGTRFGAWGPMRIYDIRNPAEPQLLSEFTTDNMKVAEMETPEVFTVHNAEAVNENEAIVSWYSDGVRWVDISNPAKPREIDAWVPPAANDPHGFAPEVPLVWGVYPLPDEDLILATDLNSGLWVLRAPGLGELEAP